MAKQGRNSGIKAEAEASPDRRAKSLWDVMTAHIVLNAYTDIISKKTEEKVGEVVNFDFSGNEQDFDLMDQTFSSIVACRSFNDLIKYATQHKKTLGDSLYDLSPSKYKTAMDKKSMGRELIRGNEVSYIVSKTKKGDALAAFNATSQIKAALECMGDLNCFAIESARKRALPKYKNKISDLDSRTSFLQERFKKCLQPLFDSLPELEREILLPYCRELSEDSENISNVDELGKLELVEGVDYYDM